MCRTGHLVCASIHPSGVISLPHSQSPLLCLYVIPRIEASLYSPYCVIVYRFLQADSLCQLHGVHDVDPLHSSSHCTAHIRHCQVSNLSRLPILEETRKNVPALELGECVFCTVSKAITMCLQALPEECE